jgi:integrase
MASVTDRWFAERRLPNGTRRRVPTARHGTGMRWLVRWRNEHGELRKKSFARRVDAERAAADIEVALARGSYRDPDAGLIRFRDYAEQYRTTQFADPLTAAQIELRLRLHVYPVFGHLPLRAITPCTIRSWTHGLRMARSYQRTIFANVSQIFSAAVADDLIAKNPCNSRKPVPDPHHVTPWRLAWVTGMRDTLPARYAIVATLAAGVGLRQGEIFGLSPDDIDFEAQTIDVRRQVKLSHGNQPYLALPKGRKTRVLPLPSVVADALHDYLATFPPRELTLPWDRPDGPPRTVSLLLTSREHKPVNRNYFNAKIWKPALIANDVPATRENGCHALRHFYASVLLDGGESIKTVSQRLGHADPAFTLRTYTHLMPDSRSRTQSIIDASLRGARPTTSVRQRAPNVPQQGR